MSPNSLMKKSLYLLRHSYADPPGGGVDFERGLTIQGLNTVRALGRNLQGDHFNPEMIISSSALRAEDTAINLVEELGIQEQVIKFDKVLYEASVREVLEVLNQVEEGVQSVLLIGHNPTMSFFAEYLTGTGFAGMEPCGFVTIEFENTNWAEVSQGAGTFVSYYHPNR